MSGPKVVRVVTREERLSECRAALARFDREARRWQALGDRAQHLDAQDVAATEARRHALHALLDADRFDELLRKVPQDIAFLKEDLARRRLQAAERAADAAQRERRVREHADGVLQSLQAQAIPADAQLLVQLESVRRGELCGPEAEALLARGFQALGTGGVVASEPTAAQRELAARLAGAEPSRSLAQWKAAQPVTAPDTRYRLIDRHLAELAHSGRDDVAERLGQRLAQVDSAPAEQRGLHLDSLVLDVAAAVGQARREEALIEEARDVQEELALHAQDADAVAARAQLAQAVEQGGVDALPAALEAARAALAHTVRRQAAQARRAAVLDGLAGLGYAVHEGMHTAWAEHGRVVLHKPALPGYGVELGGQAEGERLQVRAVALVADRDATRDRDAETAWCGDFGQLQQTLAARGHALLVERALPVGAVPLKEVATQAPDSRREGRAASRNGPGQK